MRILLAIFLFLSLNSSAQVIRANAFYRPFAVAASCDYYLDTYTGATAAYSVSRKIRTAYAGSAIRIRRSNDNSETDVGFVGCELDTASLKSFVGSNSAFVTTVYDQVNSNNATQTTAANQPRIVNAGVIDRFNGKPSLYFDGSNDFLNANAMAGLSRLDAFWVQSTSDVAYVHFYGVNNGGTFAVVAQSGSSAGVIGGFGSSAQMYYNATGPKSLTSGVNRDSVYNWLNGNRVVSIENGVTTTWSSLFKMFGYQTGFEYTGYVPEMIFYPSDQSANRTAIRNSLNSYYSVY